MRRFTSAARPSRFTSSAKPGDLARIELSSPEGRGDCAPPTPQGTRAVLRRFGIRPSKRWGQHFLVSRRALNGILEAAHLSPTDSVLEVGGGIGTLTVALAARAGWVTSIEVDQRLLPALESTAGSLANVRIVAGDVLESDLTSLFAGPLGATRKAVANLPYNIAAPILVRLLNPDARLARIIVTVQREVAERIVAAPGTESYGRLAVAVGYRGAARIVSRIPPGAFLPPPQVESAIVEIVPHPAPAVSVPDEGEFFRIVAAGFGHRRKTLLRALTHRLDLTSALVDAACRAAGVDPRARAETLGLEAWAALARALHPVLDAAPPAGVD